MDRVRLLRLYLLWQYLKEKKIKITFDLSGIRDQKKVYYHTTPAKTLQNVCNVIALAYMVNTLVACI